jgi:DNA-binding NtrC family response regulator
MVKAKAANPSMSCILLTAYGTVDLAVEAMKLGANDFFQKPVTDLSRFELCVDKAVRAAGIERDISLSAGVPAPELENFTGRSPAMERVYQLIRRAAPASANVLIEGPSGTGKELVARALHDLSPRAGGPFVAVECAALSASLLESELFGYKKGAFTGAYKDTVGRFEAADGGTLFLDEISEIDASTQVKLLRVIESRTFQRVGDSEDIKTDIRIVAATNRDLRRYVAEGKFREDLYYRLNVIDIHLPALKDRPGDVALLTDRFLREFSSANGMDAKSVDAGAMKALESYPWPGNVRQLRNVIEKTVILSGGETITVEDLPPEITGYAGDAPSEDVPAHAVAGDGNPRAPDRLKDVEKASILAELERCGGNKSKAAEALGISRRTLHRKLNEWGIKRS